MDVDRSVCRDTLHWLRLRLLVCGVNESQQRVNDPFGREATPSLVDVIDLMGPIRPEEVVGWWIDVYSGMSMTRGWHI